MKQAILTTVILSVFVLAVVFSPRGPKAGDEALWDASQTTYSAGPRGVLALYLLLDDLGLKVERLTVPGYTHLSTKTVLWLLGSQPLSRPERRDVLTFLNGGGTLVIDPSVLIALSEDVGLGDVVLHEDAKIGFTQWGAKLEDVDGVVSFDAVTPPDETFVRATDGAPVVAAWSVGAGRLVTLGAPALAFNERIGHGDAGLFLAHLASALGEHHTFDEIRHGFGATGLMDLLMRVPYRFLLAQLALVIAVALLLLVPRRWPVRTPGVAGRRRITDHIEAVARLWERAGDARLPLQALLTALESAARVRMIGAPTGRAFIDWVAARRPELQTVAQNCWEEGERVCTDAGHDSLHAMDVAATLMRIERETQQWSRNPSSKQ